MSLRTESTHTRKTLKYNALLILKLLRNPTTYELVQNVENLVQIIKLNNEHKYIKQKITSSNKNQNTKFHF